jgi:hypothetical protein
MNSSLAQTAGDMGRPAMNVTFGALDHVME